MGIFTIYDVEWAFKAAFIFLFALLAVRGLVVTVEAMYIDFEIRARYRQRAEFVENFYRIYNGQKMRIEEEKRLEQEAAEARYQASLEPADQARNARPRVA